MDRIEKEVDRILAHPSFLQKYYCNKLDLVFGTSFDGIPYALLTTSARTGSFWKIGTLGGIFSRTKKILYIVWLISCVKFNLELVKHTDPENPSPEHIIVQEIRCYTEEELNTVVEDIKKDLASGRNQYLFDVPPPDSTYPILFTTVQLPDSVTSNLDLYLYAGDVIISNFTRGFKSAAIYIGHGEIIQFMEQEDGNGGPIAQIGKITDFVKEGEVLHKIVCDYRLRDAEEIVDIANDYVRNSFHSAKYSVLTEKCQHFAMMCAFGLEFTLNGAGNGATKFIRLRS